MMERGRTGRPGAILAGWVGIALVTGAVPARAAQLSEMRPPVASASKQALCAGGPVPALARDGHVQDVLPPSVPGQETPARAYALTLDEGQAVLFTLDPARVATRMRLAIGLCGRGGFQELKYARLLPSSAETPTALRNRIRLGFTADSATRYFVRLTGVEAAALPFVLSAKTIVATAPAPSRELILAAGRGSAAGAFDAATPQRRLLGGYYRDYRIRFKKDVRYLISLSGLKGTDIDVGKQNEDIWLDNFTDLSGSSHELSDGRVVYIPDQDGNFLIRIHSDGAPTPGAYTLAVETLPIAKADEGPPPKAAIGQAIRGDLTVDGPTIPTASDNYNDNFCLYKLFQLNGNKGDTFTVTMEAKYYVYLDVGVPAPMDVDFVPAVCRHGQDEKTSKLQFTFSKKGTLLIRASAAGRGDVGPFELLVVKDKPGTKALTDFQPCPR